MDVPAATAPIPTPAPDPTPAAAPAPTPHAATAAGAAGSSGSNQQTNGTLTPVVAQLFNATAQNVVVSFQVTQNPDEVVTVFTDKATGKEIVQFPSKALIALAEMYDKDAGKVLDKNA